MKSYGKSLLKSLANVRWDVAGRTYGNDHATLIGLIIHWWISLSRKDHWALEGGPSFGYRKRGTGRGGKCDAILCNQEAAVGVFVEAGCAPDPPTPPIQRPLSSTPRERPPGRWPGIVVSNFGRGIFKQRLAALEL